jgi:hypothetical protein
VKCAARFSDVQLLEQRAAYEEREKSCALKLAPSSWTTKRLHVRSICAEDASGITKI